MNVKVKPLHTHWRHDVPNPKNARFDLPKDMNFNGNPFTGLGDNELAAFIRVYGLEQAVAELRAEIEAFNQAGATEAHE